MFTKLGALLFFVLLLSATPAAAQRWTHFYTAPAGSVWSYDQDTVVHQGDGTVEVWSRSNERRNRSVSYRWALRRYSLDCGRREITPMEFILYAPNGRIMRSELGVNRRGNPLSIAPGTMSEALLRAVCTTADTVADNPYDVLGLRYDQARQRLIGADFSPIGVSGENCPTTSESGICEYPETESCSGTGEAFCSYRWFRAGARYRLTTRDGEGGEVVWFGEDEWVDP